MSTAASTYFYQHQFTIGSVPSLSGHAIAYRWRSLPRVRWHRVSSLKVVRGTAAAFASPWTTCYCAPLFSYTHYWYKTCRLRGMDRETGRSLHPSTLVRSRREVLTEDGKVTTVCKVQGCFKTVYRDPSTGKFETDRSSPLLPGMDETGRSFHPSRYSRERSVSEHFVDRTFRGRTVSATDFELSVLTKMHPDYASVKEQFLQKWIKPDPAGGVSILRILKVKGGPCGESKCNVCSLCTHGFRLRKNVGHTARQTGMNLRFGHGMYFSSVSGKANDYAEGSEKMKRSGKLIRCMFMASVAVGQAFKTYDEGLDPSQCPPPGYDSVIGEVGPALNYDKVVVYKEGAALPTFLIVYSLN